MPVFLLGGLPLDRVALPVHLPTVTDADNVDEAGSIICAVCHPAVAYADSEEVRTTHLALAHPRGRGS